MGWVRSVRLPPVRKRARLTVQRAVKRIWLRHRRFVKKHGCVLEGTHHEHECCGRIEFSHVRSAADAGTGLKPHDWFSVSACARHHKFSHDKGAETFMARYGVDLWAMAAEFVRRSPDAAMKEAMQTCGLPYRTEHGGRLPVPRRPELVRG